jgi:hypothetical protein
MPNRSRNSWTGAVAALAAALLASAGCATIGHEFAVENVPKVSIGETTRSDVVKWFGEPWRTGLEDGRETWTYGHYRYSLFGPDKTRDLVVRFDEHGKVASYTFSSTEPEDLGGRVARSRAKS